MIIFQGAGPLGIGVLAAAAFFLIFLVAAFIAFKMLKRTVKMAVRIAIVLLILAIAFTGGIALWAFGTESGERPRPTRSR